MKNRINACIMALILVFAIGSNQVKAEGKEEINENNVGNVIEGNENKNDPFEGIIILNEMAVNLLYEDGELMGKLEVALPFGPWQRQLTEENNQWSAYEDELLTNIMDGGNVMRVTEYTFYGYSIWFTDGTKEIGHKKSLTYQELHQMELETGKRVDQIQTYYGPKSKITFNYNLVKADGSKELLLSETSFGKFDTEYPEEFKLSHESVELNKIVKRYTAVNKIEEKYPYLEENQIIEIDLRLPIYTVKFVDESGKELLERHTYYPKLDENFKFKAPEIKGYSIKENAEISVNYTNKDTEFIVKYTKDKTDPIKPVKPIDPIKPIEPIKPVLPNTGIETKASQLAISLILIGASLNGISIVKKRK